jgi:hypothetical protein
MLENDKPLDRAGTGCFKLVYNSKYNIHKPLVRWEVSQDRTEIGRTWEQAGSCEIYLGI